MRVVALWTSALLGVALSTPACVPDAGRAEQRLREAGEIVILTRVAPTTYFENGNGLGGFEYALTQELAQDLGVRARYELYDSLSEMRAALDQGHGDLIAAGLARDTTNESSLLAGPDYLELHQEVVCRRGESLPRSVTDLLERSLVVVEDGNAEHRLLGLKAEYPDLSWYTSPGLLQEQVFEKVWDGSMDCAMADSNLVSLLQPHYPELQVAFRLDGEQRLSWFVRPTDHDLQDLLNEWFPARERDRRLPALRDRHLAPSDWFDYFDILVFHTRIESRLPQYRDFFVEAAKNNNLDWTLLAAQAYQESHWRLGAESPTGVRGIMMLTQPTAREMGVASRLDPGESIRGGAGYLAKILNRISQDIEPQDRLWFALAAYNVGFGHVDDARSLTERNRRNPNLWNDVQNFLPLLAQPEYYRDLEYGYARGAEPVQYVQRIRTYYSILARRFDESG